MADSNNSSRTQKKPQKPGLNAIRPDDYTEHKFKEMAKEMNLSQTEFFQLLFWSYVKSQSNEKKQDALNLEGELNLISNDLKVLFEHFKMIVEKAQDTALSLKTNAEQTERNHSLEVDALSKKIQELEHRNTELEQTNGAFSEVKSGLEKQIEQLTGTIEQQKEAIANLKKNVIAKEKELQESLDKISRYESDIKKKEKEIERLSSELNDKSSHIKSLEAKLRDADDEARENKKQIKNFTKQVEFLEQEIKGLKMLTKNLQEDIQAKDIKIKNLESSNSSLTDTLNNMEELKKAELSSVEAKYQLIIADLEAKVKSANNLHEKEIQSLKESLRLKYEADKNLSIADMKLELADIKNKYIDALSELQFLKSKIKPAETSQ